MTDLRARRTAVLTAAAKAKSKAKADAAARPLRRLVKRGEPITFQSVQREAGVSHAFLYGNPALRTRIEHLRAQARPQPAPLGDASSDNTIIQALTSQITHLKKQHRDQTQALHAALDTWLAGSDAGAGSPAWVEWEQRKHERLLRAA